MWTNQSLLQPYIWACVQLASTSFKFLVTVPALIPCRWVIFLWLWKPLPWSCMCYIVLQAHCVFWMSASASFTATCSPLVTWCSFEMLANLFIPKWSLRRVVSKFSTLLLDQTKGQVAFLMSTQWNQSILWSQLSRYFLTLNKEMSVLPTCGPVDLLIRYTS